MFKVIVRFVDLQDNNYLYRVGDKFPRDGKFVSEKRINELKSSENKRHRALIEEVVEKVSEPIMNPPEEIIVEEVKVEEEAPKKKRTYTRKKK